MTVVAMALLLLCPGDAIYEAYARRDTTALRALFIGAATRQDSLLARYRLFPLTGDGTIIADLPEHLDDGSATEQALLAALWGYRVQDAGPVAMIRSGARSQALLEAARTRAPRNPWVLLVDAQSLLYRPRILGGDPRQASERLGLLRHGVGETGACGLPLEEVLLWQWRAADRLGAAAADSLRHALLTMAPSPLVREMLDGDW